MRDRQAARNEQTPVYLRGRSVSIPDSELRRFFDQYSDRPDMIVKPAGHRWRFLPLVQRHVNSPEVVEGEPERQR